MPNPTIQSLAPDPGGLPRAFGNFALLRRIAAGTRGEVFAALRPVEIERFCAFKIVKGDVRARADFGRAEPPAVVRRIHGTRVQIYDIGMLDDELFFVSELVEGMDVATLARKRRE